MASRPRTSRRTVDVPHADSVAPGSHQCSSEGCSRATTGRKLHCIDHLEELPYIRALVATLSERDAEGRQAMASRNRRAPDPAGSRAREVLHEIAFHGARTIERLGLAMEISTKAAEAYVESLERAGSVETLMLGSRRGKLRRVVALRPGLEALLLAV